MTLVHRDSGYPSAGDASDQGVGPGDDVEVRASSSGAALDLNLRLGREESRLSIRLTANPQVMLDGQEVAWPLWRGVPLVATNQADPFRQLVEKATRYIFAEAAAATPKGPIPDALLERARIAAARVTSAIREVALMAADQCNPRARGLALRFPPHARWYVYSKLLLDPSGRVAQVATSCPGALLWGLALVENVSGRTEHPEPTLMDDIRRGERMDKAIDRTLDAWVERARHFRGARRRRDHAEAWLRVREATGADLDRLIRQQRLLIRRATSAVPTTLLWLPPPVAFAPEDIPRQVRGVARWFRVMKAQVLLKPADQGGRAAHERFSAFISKNAETLARSRRGDPRILVRELLSYAHAHSSYPSRATRFDRYMVRFQAWRLRNRSLPVPLWGYWGRSAFAQIRALTSAGALSIEGAEMKHCVGSLAEHALRYRTTYWSALLGAARLTVALSPTLSGWRLSDLKSVANRAPTTSELSDIAGWVQAVNGASLADSGGWRPIEPHELQQPWALDRSPLPRREEAVPVGEVAWCAPITPADLGLRPHH